MLKHLAVILAVLYLLAPVASAQPSTPRTLLWDYPRPLAEVSEYVHAVSVDGVAVTGTPTCTGNTTNTLTTCALLLPILSTGAHTISVQATRNGQSATVTLTGVDLAQGPSIPGAPRVTVTVTITVS
jgi:hypothetical protein